MVIFFLAGEEMLNISLKLRRESKDQEWWLVKQLKRGPLTIGNNESEAGLHIYIFSDQVSPPSLGFLAGYG